MTDGPDIVPFEQWVPPPISIPKPPTDGPHTEAAMRDGLNGWSEEVVKHGRDGYGDPLIDLGVDHSTTNQEAVKRARIARQQERNNKFKQVPLADSWKLGLDNDWSEERTCFVDTGIHRPPFLRLHDATIHFFQSRTAAFNDTGTRGKFNNIRFVLGLKTDHPGLHWPGRGEYAQWYNMTHAALKWANKQQLEDYNNYAIGEICPLVRCPEIAVRGYIAMLRREADSIWDPARAISFAEIFAALMGYFQYHEIISDDHLAPGFDRAVRLAKAGPRLLREAFKLEQEVDKVDGLHRAGWALIGGSYGSHDINGQQALAAPPAPATGDEVGEDDGGWSVKETTTKTQATAEEAKNILAPLVAPLPIESIRVINYTAFGRRIVTAVFSPAKNEDGPAFTSTFFRLRTAPAVWSEEERWREPSPNARAGREREAEEEREEEGISSFDYPTFETEKDTIAEPAELDIWVDGTALGLDSDDDASWLVGMGFRARWAQIGVDEEHSWWIARLKDYVLPKIWRTSEADRELVKNDPRAPYSNANYQSNSAKSEETVAPKASEEVPPKTLAPSASQAPEPAVPISPEPVTSNAIRPAALETTQLVLPATSDPTSPGADSPDDEQTWDMTQFAQILKAVVGQQARQSTNDVEGAEIAAEGGGTTIRAGASASGEWGSPQAIQPSTRRTKEDEEEEDDDLPGVIGVFGGDDSDADLSDQEDEVDFTAIISQPLHESDDEDLTADKDADTGCASAFSSAATRVESSPAKTATTEPINNSAVKAVE